MKLRTRLALLIPSIILIAVFVYFFSSIIAYFLIAAIVSFVGRPVMKALTNLEFKRFKLPNWACALLSLLTVYGTVTLLFLLLIPIIGKQASSLTSINTEEVIENFEKPISTLEAWMEKYQLEFPEPPSENTEETESPTPAPINQRIILVAVDSQEIVPLNQLNPTSISPDLYAELRQIEQQEPLAKPEAVDSSAVLSNRQKVADYIESSMIDLVSGIQISSLFNVLGEFVGNLFLAIFAISFISFFLLKESHLLTNIILTVSPSGYEEKVQTILTKVKPLLTRYFIGVLVEVLLVGCLIAIGLSLLGVKNALFIGLFAGTLNVIPYLGPIIGAVLGLTLTALGHLDYDLTSQLLPLLLEVAGVFALVQILDNILFSP